MSYKIEVVITHEFRFATKIEADAYAEGLFGQWPGCTIRVAESSDKINYPPPDDDDDDTD